MKNLKTLLAAVIGALVWLAPAWASPLSPCGEAFGAGHRALVTLLSPGAVSRDTPDTRRPTERRSEFIADAVRCAASRERRRVSGMSRLTAPGEVKVTSARCPAPNGSGQGERGDAQAGACPAICARATR